MCQVGKKDHVLRRYRFSTRGYIPSKTRKRCILADEKAVGDCKRTRRTGHHEPDVVGRRVCLYRYGPYLESVMLE
jgi:hypothetical protein